VRLRRDARRHAGVRRRWIQAWPGGAVIGIANGITREATYGKLMSGGAAHQTSTLTAIAAFAAYFSVLENHWPIETRASALEIGAAWLSLTVAFEFTFGRLVAKQSWEQMLADYNLKAGRTWPLVLAWIGVGPLVVSELDP
jgi:hypothetical protein